MPIRGSSFLILSFVTLAASAACSDAKTKSALRNDSATAVPAAVATAASAIDSASLLGYIKDISADSMEGRAPGTPGEDKTVAYLTKQFQALGLAPGNPDGTYIQNVDLVRYVSHPTVTITAGGKNIAITAPDDMIVNSRHQRAETKITNSDIVFVGYGIVAPEYGWDDYKGVDVKGKTILMLVNDPPITLPNDTATLDTTMFKGKAMTYYGRWTYKYEIATQKGAAAAIVIHEMGPAGYPFEALGGSKSQEVFDVPYLEAEQRVPIEGWIRGEKAKELIADAGQNFDSLKAAARRKDFKPVALDAKASFDVKIDAQQMKSRNVVAKLAGSTHPDEVVIYTAHWDHFGRDTTRQGDQILNGAIDNASGTAGLLELAKAFKKLSPAPQRSVVFLAVTGEEKGLVGSAFYATHPLYPLNKTAAEINMDELDVWGPMSDMTVIGFGNSTLDDVLARVLAADKRTTHPDPEPEKGFYYRSDHFSFAKQGVPALYTEPGVDLVGQPAGSGKILRDRYDETDYHKPSDEVKPDWDLRGAVADLRALFEVGWTVANSTDWPQWKPGTEFKAKRDSAMVRR